MPYLGAQEAAKPIFRWMASLMSHLPFCATNGIATNLSGDYEATTK
ncbi:MAG: hypothetical protein JWM16_23 [Verrucomicrobiales bacterium]|nr:hypothetical protein [Verrucomicrobiales bacterium]